MELPATNLLSRVDPTDSALPRHHSHDHDHFLLSFRPKPVATAAGGDPGTGGGSPLSVSPPALRLGVKERWDFSPRSVVTSLKAWPPSTEMGHEKACEGGGSRPREADMLDRTRLLSLGIWDEGAVMEDMANAVAASAAADVVQADQGVPDEKASAVAKGGGRLQLQA